MTKPQIHDLATDALELLPKELRASSRKAVEKGVRLGVEHAIVLIAEESVACAPCVAWRNKIIKQLRVES